MSEYRISIMDHQTNQPIKSVMVMGKKRPKGGMINLGYFMSDENT